MVDVRTRRRCSRCRLDRCLRNGMRPEMVLTGREKTRRFRKFIAKKKRKLEAVTSVEGELSSSSTTSAARVAVPSPSLGGRSQLLAPPSSLASSSSSFAVRSSLMSSSASAASPMASPVIKTEIVTSDEIPCLPWEHPRRASSGGGGGGEGRLQLQWGLTRGTGDVAPARGGFGSVLRPAPGLGPGSGGHEREREEEQVRRDAGATSLHFKKKFREEYLQFCDENLPQPLVLRQPPGLRGANAEPAVRFPIGQELARIHGHGGKLGLFRAWEEPKWVEAEAEDLKPGAGRPQGGKGGGEREAQRARGMVDQKGGNLLVLRQMLFSVLRDNMKEFRRFAQDHGGALQDQEDREALARQNKKLYLNYVFGRFASASDRLEKLLWISCQHHHVRDLQELVDHGDLITELGMFGGDEAMQRLYAVLSSSLGRCAVRPRSKSLIAKTLFFYQGSLTLNSPMPVIVQFLQSIQELQKSEGVVYQTDDVYEMASSLESMVTLFQHSGLTGRYLPCYSDDAGPLNGSHAPRFTSEEASWLARRRDVFYESFYSVVVSRTVMEATLNFCTRRIPFQPDFWRENLNFWGERFRRAHKSHAEFLALLDADQAAVWSESFGGALSLISCKLDDCKVPDQLRTVFGSQAVASFPPDMLDPRCPMESVRVGDMPLRLPPEWHRTKRRVQAAMRGPRGQLTFFALLYGVMFLPVSKALEKGATATGTSATATATATAGATATTTAMAPMSSLRRQKWERLAALHRRYELVLARAVADMGEEEDGEEEERFVREVRQMVADLERMGEMMQAGSLT